MSNFANVLYITQKWKYLLAVLIFLDSRKLRISDKSICSIHYFYLASEFYCEQADVCTHFPAKMLLVNGVIEPNTSADNCFYNCCHDKIDRKLCAKNSLMNYAMQS